VPPPFTGQGSGNQASVPVTIPGGAIGIAHITSNGGSGAFTVQPLDSSNNAIGGPIVDRQAGYQGNVVVPAGTVAFEITADGTWAFEINAPGAARTFDGRNDQGNGDDVVFYDGDPTTAHITFGGDGPFVVSSFANNGAVDQLVDEAAGPYDDSVGFPGPALVAVSGDGRWTISLG